ncbi:MAG: hypothetical protein OEZ13_08880 [Spirochaetia bacterium]|nr:hypothetical protein [Spirochaetia bacterium]
MLKKILILIIFVTSNYTLLAEDKNFAEEKREKALTLVCLGTHFSANFNFGLIYGTGIQEKFFVEWLDVMPFYASIAWETEPKFKKHTMIVGLEAGYMFKPFNSVHIQLNYEFNYRIFSEPVSYSNYLKPGIIYHFDKDIVTNRTNDRVGIMIYGHLPSLNFKSVGIKEPYGIYIVFTNTRI